MMTILNLTPNIINCLVALKSLLELGDMELSRIASSRLEINRNEESINLILLALEKHHYAEALSLIDQLLAEGTRLTKWNDPEIALMEAELEKVTSDLADLEAELAELEHLISRFQAAHNEALGTKIRKLLKLRIRWLKHQSEFDPTQQDAHEQANRDFEEFEQDQDAQKENDVRTNWVLSEEEQKELKSLFRKGSKKCHPDLVAEEQRDAAARMFHELRDAYERGDLARLQMLVIRLDSGLFDMPYNAANDEAQKKARLKAKIATIREATEKTKTDVNAIKISSTYATMTSHKDWAALFRDQAILLDQEIENLARIMEEEDDT
jgi:hypothetical protein